MTMPPTDAKSRELVLNVAPINVPDKKIEVGVEPYERPAEGRAEDNLAKLRRQHYKTHVFLRRDSSILCVPVTEDAEQLGSDTREVALHHDYGLVGALVVYAAWYWGYRRLSFILASSVVNRQSTLRSEVLRSCCHGPTLWRRAAIDPVRVRRQWRDRTLNSHSATFNQLPCFGV